RGRAQLNLLFGTRGWLLPAAVHDDQGAERFADTLAAAYWPSADNVATAFVRPAAFRALLAQLLPASLPLTRSATAAARSRPPARSASSIPSIRGMRRSSIASAVFVFSIPVSASSPSRAWPTISTLWAPR